MKARTAIDFDWPLSAAALLVALGSAYLLAHPSALRPVGWVAPTEPAGVLAFNLGEVRRRPAGSLVWYPTETGDTVYAGDALFVARKSVATVALDSGAKLEIDENTLLVLEKPREEAGSSPSTGRVLVEKGSVSGAASGTALQISAGNSVTALPPGAEAQVQFTRAGDGRAGPGQVQVGVRKGRVSVQTAAGANALQDREQARIDPEGGAVTRQTRPIALVSPPPFYVHLGTPGRPLRLLWAPADAAGARVQIAVDRQFDDVERAAPAVGGALDAAGLAPGAYWWRLVDQAGAPLSETRQLTVLADQAPLLASPGADDRIEGSLVTFGWSRVDGANSYQLQVASDPGFTQPVFEVAASGDRASWPTATDGNFHWRVRARHGELWGQWSEPSPFRVTQRPLPGAPVLFDPVFDLGGHDAGLP